ncbi:hypothetical protein [Nannocystis radixulma]|uniref:Uncharacterized protein n=1 Tax=Nannocystis radixulma TaxID=2995305 RepID=A0ABT5AYB7_9BACT|nr:hypothetical protein [Nannocystis radixulma]MDC0666445.1 hypothetical protein [Nannocystis radixulma]
MIYAERRAKGWVEPCVLELLVSRHVRLELDERVKALTEDRSVFRTANLVGVASLQMSYLSTVPIIVGRASLSDDMPESMAEETLGSFPLDPRRS